jgi:hypothetical protein
MAKCILCNSKSKRFCVVLNENICSYCCGSKRGKDIECTLSCLIYKESLIKSNHSEAIKEAKANFNNQYEDMFRKEGIPEIAGIFEAYIFETYYNDSSINDQDLLACYIKIYWILKGCETLYDLEDYEKAILEQYNAVIKQSNSDLDLKTNLILRLVRSILDVTGGCFGHRNYLELLRGMLTNTGRIAQAFHGDEEPY